MVKSQVAVWGKCGGKEGIARILWGKAKIAVLSERFPGPRPLSDHTRPDKDHRTRTQSQRDGTPTRTREGMDFDHGGKPENEFEYAYEGFINPSYSGFQGIQGR